MRPRALIVYLEDVTHVARVHRQVEALLPEFDVTVAAPGSVPDLPGVASVELRPVRQSPSRSRAESLARVGLRLAGGYERAYWRDARVRAWRAQLQELLPVDVVVVNHLFSLPLAFSLDPLPPVVFDAHEHWTSESASWDLRERMSMRRAHEWIVDAFVPRTAGMTTVSRGIARDFAARAGTQPELVTNAPKYRPLEPSPVTEPIRLVHFGMADERRRLEDTIEAVGLLDDRFTLDLALARDNEYRVRLERMAASIGRVRVLPPVPQNELLDFANAYDVGVFLLPPRYPNQLHVLPNKLFDYIQARLAIAIGPSPEMAEVVTEWDCGVVSDAFTPESFAAALGALTVEEVSRLKANADNAARVVNADANRDTILSVVQRAIRTRVGT